MELISQTAVEGRPGPVFPEAYARVDDLKFNKAMTFVHGQPFDRFAQLRKAAPVCWHPEPEGLPGFWVVTRHADVMRVNGDPATFSSQRGGILMNTPRPEQGHVLLGRASLDTMINLDAPNHLQLRREHMPFFTPAYLNGLKTKVAAEVTRMVDEMAPKGGGDLVEMFSSRLPLYTLCEILGVPEPDRAKFLHWMHYLELAQNLAAEQAALHQDRYHLIDEPLEPGRQHRRHHVEAVGGAVPEPVLHLVCNLLRRADRQHVPARPGIGEAELP